MADGKKTAARYLSDFKRHRQRADKCWQGREPWLKFYDDAYEFAIPYRQSAARAGKAQQKIERLFDATAIKSTFAAAGQLHQDLFGPDFYKLAPGPVAKAGLDAQAVAALAAELEKVTATSSAFFQTGEFEMASNETCIDLMVGTGSLFPVEGDARNPVRWVCIPIDALAIECDAYGAVCLIVWRTSMARRAIRDAFPDGRYPQAFSDAINNGNGADEEIELRQDFVCDPQSGRWTFCAYIEASEDTIVEEQYGVQPMAVPRFHRVPGEAYGRGRVLLAMATIKTLNKATELLLKSAAMQMLGIWGYRPGGAFNPDTVRLGPGEFWPMQGTGGVLGPDVTRLDTAAGKTDIGLLITQELRTQVQMLLGDEQLPDRGATPISATEVIERMKRISQNYLGAFGRVVHETVPVIVRRVIEILYRKKILTTKIDIDTLLIKVEVLSPIAAAVKAAAHSRIIDFIQLCVLLKGDPLAAQLIVKVDDALRAIGADLVPASLMRTPNEQAELEQLIGALAAQMVAAQQAQSQGAAA